MFMKAKTILGTYKVPWIVLIWMQKHKNWCYDFIFPFPIILCKENEVVGITSGSTYVLLCILINLCTLSQLILDFINPRGLHEKYKWIHCLIFIYVQYCLQYLWIIITGPWRFNLAMNIPWGISELKTCSFSKFQVEYV